MFNLPLDMLSPRLLPHPAKTSPAFDHLEGGQIAGVIFDGDKAAWMQKLNHVARGTAAAWWMFCGHDR